MYHLLSGFYAEWTRKERFNILILGLGGVGKSSSLEKIKSIYLGQPPLPPHKIVPTVGQNVFQLTLPSSQLYFWDVGGSPSVRSLWSKYYQESNAVVFVIDATEFLDYNNDEELKGKSKATHIDSEIRRQETWSTFSSLIQDPVLDGVPILILANKMDSCLDSSPQSITVKIKHWLKTNLDETTMSLNGSSPSFRLGKLDTSTSSNIDNDYDWHVIATSALDGTGLNDAVNWLSQNVSKSKR